jgi:hypothetical protein
MSGNSTTGEGESQALVVAISIGSFFGILLVCSCCAIAYHCVSKYLPNDEPKDPSTLVEVNPMTQTSISVRVTPSEEDPS